MNHETFTRIFEEQVEKCRNTLVTKASEYAEDDDRLHNFRVAADLQCCDLRSSLGGMMAKHIVSIYDLIDREELAPQEVWDEKIGDALNYLFLLMAVVHEERLGIAFEEYYNSTPQDTGSFEYNLARIEDSLKFIRKTMRENEAYQ